MTEAFRVVSAWNKRVIVLEQKQWNGVMLPNRPEMSDRLAAIQRSCELPSFVTKDPDDGDWNFHYLRRKDGSFIRVAVEYRRRLKLWSMTGVVRDARMVQGKFPREVLVWTLAM